jgi:archaemetzincin
MEKLSQNNLLLKNKLSYLLHPALIFLAGCNHNSSPETPATPDKIGIASFYTTLDTPQPGEWLYEHYEAGQTLGHFKHTTPITAADSNSVICLMPLGFSSDNDYKLLQTLSEYLSAVFQHPVVVTKNKSLNMIPDSAIRDTQLLSGFILNNLLMADLREDALGLMAITPYDLYPDENWNYVFGEANTQKRVGVSSYARYGSLGQDEATDKIILLRLMKTATHEFLHMMGLMHCVDYACVLNGSNSLPESDSRPVMMCPDCLDKLAAIFPEAAANYFKNTLSFYNKYQFETEAAFCNKIIQHQQH